MELPEFKYNPNAYKLKIIRKKNIVCECCGNKSEYCYDGPFYSIDDIEKICPWCISNGSASKKFDGKFQDDESVDECENLEAVEEVTKRTPGYSGWQQEVWLAHCDDLCAFTGFAKSKQIKEYIEDLKEDLENSGYGDIDELMEGIEEEALGAYLFECLHCGKHRIHIDCD